MKKMLMIGHSVLAYYKESRIDEYQITNLAKVGTIAQDGVKMLEKNPVEWSDYDIVLLMYGINEAYYRFKLERLISGLRNILDNINVSSNRPKVILSDIILPWKTDRLDPLVLTEWNLSISQLRQEYQCLPLDWAELYNSDGQVDPSYSIDGIHLNNKGYDLFTEELSRVIKNSKA